MHWRDSGRVVKFFKVDGRVAIGLVIWIIHWSWVTFSLAVGLMIFFGILERFDYTLPNAARKLRILLIGKKKYVKNKIKERKYRSG